MEIGVAHPVPREELVQTNASSRERDERVTPEPVDAGNPRGIPGARNPRGNVPRCDAFGLDPDAAEPGVKPVERRPDNDGIVLQHHLPDVAVGEAVRLLLREGAPHVLLRLLRLRGAQRHIPPSVRNSDDVVTVSPANGLRTAARPERLGHGSEKGVRAPELEKSRFHRAVVPLQGPAASTSCALPLYPLRRCAARS